MSPDVFIQRSMYFEMVKIISGNCEGDIIATRTGIAIVLFNRKKIFERFCTQIYVLMKI